jgi:hypothetical protein
MRYSKLVSIREEAIIGIPKYQELNPMPRERRWIILFKRKAKYARFSLLPTM